MTNNNVTFDFTVNGKPVSVSCEPRTTLTDVLREELHLTGTHAGCEHGACGACTIIVDGKAVRSCLMLGVQAAGKDVVTVEGIAPEPGQLSSVQQAMQDCHGLQCGFCTPGIVVSMTAFLKDNPDPTDDQIREAMSGNYCRCTGYTGIMNAARQVVRNSKGAK